jgi:DNA-binding GntR family transcriptional regulator
MVKGQKAPHKTRTVSVRHKAYTHMQRQIASGVMKPGDTVSELNLARELGSSRTPVREAIGQLVAEGLLAQGPNGSTLVVQLQREDIIDLYEVREALEVYSIGKAASSGIRPESQERLQQLVDHLLVLKKELEDTGGTYLNPEQMNRFIACDMGFHAMLMSLAQNSRILKVINETRLLIRFFAVHRQGLNADTLQRLRNQHQELLDAVVAMKRETAMELLSKHIRCSQQERIEDFDLWKREASIRENMPAFFDMHESLILR